MGFSVHQNLLLYDRRVIFEAHSKIFLCGEPLEGKALVDIDSDFLWLTTHNEQVFLSPKLNMSSRHIEPDYLWDLICNNILLVDHTGKIVWFLEHVIKEKTSIHYYGAYYSNQRQKWVAKSKIGSEYAINLEDGTLSESIFVGNR